MAEPPAYNHPEGEEPPPFDRVDSVHSIDPLRRPSTLDSLLEEAELDSAQHTDLGLHPPEDLPGYDAQSLPLYEDARLETPVVTYTLTQVGRSVQSLRPSHQLCARWPWYNINFRSSLSMFSKKADMAMLRLTGTGRRDSAVAEEQKGEETATMSFDKTSTLPWMPRAWVALSPSSTSSDATVYKLSAPNFNDWKVSFDNKSLTWGLSSNPWSMVLFDRTVDIVARFIYSCNGTLAQKGEELGRLEIYSGHRAETDERTVEFILATCLVAVQHYKNMGRHYRNSKGAERPSFASIRRNSARMRSGISTSGGLQHQ